MSNPNDVKYHESHTWIRAEAGGLYSVGITGHAQEQLGDVVYVQQPAVGSSVKQGEPCAVIECAGLRRGGRSQRRAGRRARSGQRRPLCRVVVSYPAR
jgi:hypothetical protein